MAFGAKKEQTTQPDIKPRLEPYEIHVMPQKFHKYLAVKKAGLGKMAIIFLVIILVMAGLASAAYYFMYLQQPILPANLNQPADNLNLDNININIPVNENTNDNINTDSNANVYENTNVNLNDNSNVNLNANSNTNTNVNAPIPGVVLVYSGTTDSDGDGLTDVEEALYDTEKNKPDTDADGYPDGQEVINGFNPKAASGSNLETSGLVNKYTNPTFNYEILHIADWLAKPTDSSFREVIFQSATGEFINVLVEDNTKLVNLVNWYLEQSPLTDVSSLTNGKTRQGYEALISADKLTYYLQIPERQDKIFVITYNIGPKTKVNFLTTYQMMINSFKLVNAAVTTPEPPVTPEPQPTDNQ